MMKCLKKRKPVQNPPEQNRISAKASGSSGIGRVRKRMYRQAALATMTIILTVVVLFAMTSAWYSNVVQTSGLTFEAESWGFEGKITVGNEAIIASPGDGGIIDLTVENDNDSVSTISVNVYKNAMTEEMQKRLYFYVDTRMNRNGETMERVYLNRFEGFTYNVFNNSQLTLTKEFNNAPVIKWEWVYDVLGYYVVGEPYEVPVTDEGGTDGSGTDDGDGTTGQTETVTQRMDVKEYLRPIIYDFDEATTLIGTDGESIGIELLTIDGVLTPEQFLTELSKVDGYEGVIDASDHAFGGYYKVDVDEDEDGYGVYAYLCNYSEIQQEINYDAYLGQLAYDKENGGTLTDDQKKELQHRATLTLSAQKDDNTVTTVSTIGSLQSAIASGVADVIQLSSDMTLAEEGAIVIPENQRVMLDLNGNTLTNQDGAAITALPGSSLTLTNGTLQQEENQAVTDTTYGVRAVGAEVIMSQMKINDFQYGVYVGDNTGGNSLDSRVHIMNSTITGETCAAFISGNGLLSDQKSRLIIENSKLYSYGIVVSGNGDASGNGRWGTDIQIINSTISGLAKEGTSAYGLGIYQPQKSSTLMVINSTVEGYNGITLKGGSAKIDNSTIIGKGAHQEPDFEGSGSTDTGDAVYIETNYGYDIQLLICGDSSLKHEDVNSRSLRLYKEDATNVQVEIEGGIFDEEQPAGYLAEGCTQEVITEEQNHGRYRIIESKQTGEITGEQSNETT